MKKMLLSSLLILLSVWCFAQAKKIAVLTSSLVSDDELDYTPFIRSYIGDHLKTIPGIVVAPVNSTLSNTAKIKRSNINGTFVDNAAVKTAAETGSNVLAIVYYNASIIEKKVLEPGQESTSYGCEMELYIQLINTTNAQILNSKRIYLSMGLKYKQGENYKTKEEAVKAALASPAFVDDKKSMSANLDTYLAENIK